MKAEKDGYIRSVVRQREIDSLDKKENKIVRKMVTYDENDNQIDCSKIIYDIDRDSPGGGRPYYYVSNQLDEKGFFTDLPYDAFRHVLFGAGDGIVQKNVLGAMITKVIRFVDRSYGEIVRRITIDGYRDAKFKYGVMFNWYKANSSGWIVCRRDGNATEPIIGIFVDQNNVHPIAFDTADEAKAYIAGIKQRADDMYHNFIGTIYKNAKKGNPEDMEQKTLRFYANYLFPETPISLDKKEEVDALSVAITESVVINIADSIYKKKVMHDKDNGCFLKVIQIMV